MIYLSLLSGQYISRTDHHNPLDSQITQSWNMVWQTFTRGQSVSSHTLNNLLQITVHKHKGSDFSAFKVAVKTE